MRLAETSYPKCPAGDERRGLITRPYPPQARFWLEWGCSIENIAIRPAFRMGRYGELNARAPRIPLTAKAPTIRKTPSVFPWSGRVHFRKRMPQGLLLTQQSISSEAYFSPSSVITSSRQRGHRRHVCANPGHIPSIRTSDPNFCLDSDLLSF
jgi:hypothetical protein